MYTLEIMNGGTVLAPLVKEGIKWETIRKGSPGKLEFTALADSNLVVKQGNPVRFRVYENGVWNDVFFGYIFKISYGKDMEMKFTCYDQLRYFKNKDDYSYGNITASELLKMICDDMHVRYGDICDTGYVIPSRLENNKTMFDIVQNALDLSMQYTGRVFCLYDDYGRICLQNIADRKVNIILDEDTGENYEYTETIDSDVYNQVKLTYENTGKREVYLTRDSSNINEWGLLQYYDTLKEGENGKAKADVLLQFYNKLNKSFSMKDMFGDVRVRAGTFPLVHMNLPQYDIYNFMLVEKATHTFNENNHKMTLTLSGGEFRE